MSNEIIEKQPESVSAAQPSAPIALKKKKKHSRKRILAIVIPVVAAAAILTFFLTRNKGEETTVSLTDYTVSRGDLNVSISGSGSVEPKDQYSVVSLVEGDITGDYFTKGQEIQEGDLLYTIDASDLERSLTQSETSLKKAQENYQDAQDDLNNLNVKAEISGLVTDLKVSVGDQVQANSTIAEVADTSTLVVTLPFISTDAQKLYVGQTAVITLEDYDSTVTGKVVRISSGQQTSGSGALVTDVELSFSNPGAVQPGATVTAVVGGIYACQSSGTTEWASDGKIVAKTAGQVTSLNIHTGDSVKAGTVVAVLDSDSAESALENAETSLENAQISYENAQDQLNNYNITAPISGTVVTKNSKAGDKISSSSTTMAVIADMSQLVLDIDVDELDILSLKEGQQATITADALDGQVFTGTVENISTMGTSSSGGVTTYEVRIVIDDYGDLLPGMSVDAEIQVESATDVLMVPVEAVVRGNYVLVKTDSAAASSNPTAETSANPSILGDVPDGYEYVQVETGIANDEYIEITSGLSEGDVVGYTPDTASDTTSGFPMGGGSITGGITGGGGSGMTGGGSAPAGGGSAPGGGSSSGGATRSSYSGSYRSAFSGTGQSS
ncbi:efflux RND transporter periplasmic adaptor subunit [Papillibacter cinnamivorans]|uniref:HlyD family secretion protein n=1 Tax=Papillibacter cinnamivorans DSM 12816 TaxID=1122930 RepID=A0A1W2C669_9FIRM|nr:efflux RND transporter periplasmic adaptor subunit [Papillibacter cinnamivorans]SMC80757.1 HlyD family secretion protein [Papillibacter cinnamivorans DSM 12816]